VDRDLSASTQAAASAQTCPPFPGTAMFDEQSEAPPSLDDPTLEICKRELEAVLASLGA
jgi:hypothetical protein